MKRDRARKGKDKKPDAVGLAVDATGHVRVPVVLMLGTKVYATATLHGIPQPLSLLSLNDTGCQWLVQLVNYTTRTAQLHVLPANLAAGRAYVAHLERSDVDAMADAS